MYRRIYTLEAHSRRENVAISAFRCPFRELLCSFLFFGVDFQLHSSVLDGYYMHFRKKSFYFFRQVEKSHFITLSEKYSNRKLTQEDMKIISSKVQDVWDYAQDEFYDLYNQ